MGGTFVARGFSGDKEHLVPLIQAAIRHRGFALIDVLSPCVTFNDHEDSTKSYAFTRQFYHPAVHTDFVRPASEIAAEYQAGDSVEVILHDGSRICLRKAREDYDPTDREKAFGYVKRRMREGEYLTGLLYVETEGREMHEINHTVETPLNEMPFESLCPGAGALDGILSRYR
jgi:2-oxoglutarate ferredoxin oxidoreductase subunit beta